MLKPIKSSMICAAVLTALVVGCAGHEESDADASESEVVVGVADLSNKVAVYPDRLEFDADVVGQIERRGLLAKIDASKKQVGAEPVYFVGNRQSDALDEDGSVKAGVRNGAGYLRRAVSWRKGEGGVLVVMTEAATLAEAIEEVKKNGFVGLEAKALQPLANSDVTDFDKGNFEKTLTHVFGPNANGLAPLDFSGKELFSKRLLLGGQAKLVLSRGRLEIKPVLDAQISIKNFAPQKTKVTLATEVQGEIEITASSDGAFDVQNGSTLFSKSFGAAVSGVPLTLSVDVRWKCGVGMSGASVASVGATAKGRVSGGAEFEGGRFKGLFEQPTFELARLGPTFKANANVNGECHLVSELGVQLFDTVGPNATVDLYTKVAARASAGTSNGLSASVKAGVEARVGGSLRPFGVKIGQISTPPLVSEKEVFNGPVPLGN